MSRNADLSIIIPARNEQFLNNTIEDILNIAFSHFNLNWKDYVKTSEKFIRPAETRPLLAEPSFAKNHLNWKPKVDFKNLILMMLENDLSDLQK